MSDNVKENGAHSSEIREEAERLEVKKDLRDLADEILQFGEEVISQNGLSTEPERGNTASAFMKSTDKIVAAWTGSDKARPLTRSAEALDKMLKGDTSILSVGFNYDGEATMSDLRKKGTFGSGDEFGTRVNEAMLRKLGYLGEGEQIGQPLPNSNQEVILGEGINRNKANIVIDDPDKQFVVMGHTAKTREGKYVVKDFSINHRSNPDLSRRLQLNRNIPKGL